MSEWKKPEDMHIPEVKPLIDAIRRGEVHLKGPEDILADEIEILRSAVKSLEEQLAGAKKRALYFEEAGIEVQRERDALRKALEKIWYESVDIVHARQIAEQSINGQGGEP